MSRATRANESGPVVSTSFPGQLGPWSDGSRCRTSFPGITGPWLRACGVDQLSQETRLQLAREVPRARPAVPRDFGLGLWALGVNQLSRGTRAFVPGPAELTSYPRRHGAVAACPQCLPADPGNSSPCPGACMVDQLSRATHARVLVQGPAGSTKCPGHFGIRT